MSAAVHEPLMLCHAMLFAGEPDEGRPWKEVARRHADTGGLAGREGVGKFTDDTQMGLALAKSLARNLPVLQSALLPSASHINIRPADGNNL